LKIRNTTYFENENVIIIFYEIIEKEIIVDLIIDW